MSVSLGICKQKKFTDIWIISQVQSLVLLLSDIFSLLLKGSFITSNPNDLSSCSFLIFPRRLRSFKVLKCLRFIQWEEKSSAFCWGFLAPHKIDSIVGWDRDRGDPGGIGGNQGGWSRPGNPMKWGWVGWRSGLPGFWVVTWVRMMTTIRCYNPKSQPK